ncbi:MAG: hypothetical protein ACLP5H_24040 [Desulfomonilaceae bacterium]
MEKEPKSSPEKRTGEFLACGRGQAEQIEDIRKYGNHGASPVLNVN